MKNLYYKILLLVLLPSITFASNNKDGLHGKYNKEKTLTKEFAVSKDALLKISNDYGNIDITSWNENRIVLEINIKVSGNDEERVLNKLKSIDVNFESSPQRVSAKTVFNKSNESWWDKLSFGWNSNLNMKINYTVKMPVTNRIDIDNDYGNINLDKIEGHAKINCDYGQIILGELLANDNYINIDYTNNSTIRYIKSGKINADYSDFEIENADRIDLNADYTQSRFKTIKYLNYNCDYGGIKIEKGGKITGDSDYVSTKIGTVTNELDIEADYGSLVIYALQSSFNHVKIDTDYTRIDIGYENDCNFDFDIKSSYGRIRVDDDITVQKKYVKDSRQEYQGYMGTKNSGNKISIITSYGGIKLRKN